MKFLIFTKLFRKLISALIFVGVIVFGSDQEVAELMKAVKRQNATGHFFWIGSDGWSARALVSDGKHKLCPFKIVPFYILYVYTYSTDL